MPEDCTFHSIENFGTHKAVRMRWNRPRMEHTGTGWRRVGSFVLDCKSLEARIHNLEAARQDASESRRALAALRRSG